ncbi:MAG: PIG-L family deacetylase [Gammaproteobacteria bacterium]|nr:PIG-L family deacetylase [Gammaproteobacteria bacterium]
MFNLSFGDSEAKICEVLCLGAHADDIEIGCGGTILYLAEKYPRTNVRWIVFSATKERQKEAQQSAARFLQNVRHKDIIVHEFKDGFFPYTGDKIKEVFEELKNGPSPDVIFTHTSGDRHQDHRLVSELAWNTFRNHLILEYEIPKYDGDIGNPNVFVHLSNRICTQKIDYLMAYFATQTDKHWFTRETFEAILRLRGIESRAPENFAEAFYCRKLVVG